MQNRKNAIIIGAGPAGLTAAYELLKKTDIKPIIIEESDAIGGISKTVCYKGNRMDIGGHRFFSKDERVTELWQQLMPTQGKPAYDDIILKNEKEYNKGGPDPEKDDVTMLIRRRVSRIYFLRKFFDYPITLKFETLKNMGFLRTVQAGFGYLYSCVFKKKEDNLKNFYINRFGAPLYRMFFEDYTEKLWGVNPEKIGADWGAQRVKGLSLRKAVWQMLKKPFAKGNSKHIETSLIEQYMYPKRGPGQLWEITAEKIVEMGGEIVMNTKVDRVTLNGEKINSVEGVCNGKRTEFCGDYFFSSMPVKDLISAMGDSVPENVSRVASALPYRDFMTVGILAKKLKIQNKTKMKTLGNIVPDCWIYIQERDVKIGRLQIFNNWSPYMVKDPDNTVWIGLEYFCNENDEMWNMTDEQFTELALDEITKIGIIDREDVIDSVRIKVKKAYPAYFGTYNEFGSVRSYLDKIENLFCIGRNGQHRYNNMDHSMATAMEAVKLVKNKCKSKEPVWNVNTDKEYHEEK